MGTSLSTKSIEKLTPAHCLDGFDCGVPDLNRYLIQYAYQNQAANSANTYVACASQTVFGYYTLTVGSVIHKSAPKRVIQGLAKYPVPVMILARLAVDQSQQKQGVGKGLLKDALLRTVNAANIAGIRALLVHAKDDKAKNWYQQYGFEPSPTDPLHLFLLMKDIRKSLS